MRRSSDFNEFFGKEDKEKINLSIPNDQKPRV